MTADQAMDFIFDWSMPVLLAALIIGIAVNWVKGD